MYIQEVIDVFSFHNQNDRGQIRCIYMCVYKKKQQQKNNVTEVFPDKTQILYTKYHKTQPLTTYTTYCYIWHADVQRLFPWCYLWDKTWKALAPFSQNELQPHYIFALLNVVKSLSVIICSGIILMYDSDYHKLLVCIDLCIHF